MGDTVYISSPPKLAILVIQFDDKEIRLELKDGKFCLVNRNGDPPTDEEIDQAARGFFNSIMQHCHKTDLGRLNWRKVLLFLKEHQTDVITWDRDGSVSFNISNCVDDSYHPPNNIIEYCNEEDEFLSEKEPIP